MTPKIKHEIKPSSAASMVPPWIAKMLEVVLSSLVTFLAKRALEPPAPAQWIVISSPSSIGWLREFAIWGPVLLVAAISILLVVQNRWRRSRRVLVLALVVFVAVGLATASDRFTTGSRRVAPQFWLKGVSQDRFWYHYVIVQATSGGDCSLQEPFPLRADSEGGWRIWVTIGGESRSEHYVIVIASESPQSAFSRPGGFDCREIPQTPYRQQIVVVRE